MLLAWARPASKHGHPHWTRRELPLPLPLPLDLPLPLASSLQRAPCVPCLTATVSLVRPSPHSSSSPPPRVLLPNSSSGVRTHAPTSNLWQPSPCAFSPCRPENARSFRQPPGQAFS